MSLKNLQGVQRTNFQFRNQTGFYSGKVRDVYYFDKDATQNTLNSEAKMAMVVTDRISAFDVVLPRSIPFKGQILNKLAVSFLAKTTDILPNWVISMPHANATIGRKCEPFKVEMVIRGYLAGHAWREYQSGRRSICGVVLPEGLSENDLLPYPIITPTTKASEGHDQDISREQIIAAGIVSKEDYEKLEFYTKELYKRGSEIAKKQNLILVDTKYEFGKVDDVIYLIDEIHTPDSSRYFYADTYETNQRDKTPQRQLSKEFVRQWLIENGFQGKEGQKIPEMTDEIVNSISARYIELYEHLIGEKFQDTAFYIDNDLEKGIEDAVKNALEAML